MTDEFKFAAVTQNDKQETGVSQHSQAVEVQRYLEIMTEYLVRRRSCKIRSAHRRWHV